MSRNMGELQKSKSGREIVEPNLGDWRDPTIKLSFAVTRHYTN